MLIGRTDFEDKFQPCEVTMNILLMINSNDPELKWNAVRFGNVLLEGGDDVSIFLNGPAAAWYEGNSEALPIKELTKIFCLSEGALCA